GVDFAVVEGFKNSKLPKFVLSDIEVDECLRKISLSELNDDLITELTKQVLSLDDYQADS
ncbi:MAG: molybdopterin-guanine dinucleotide biosynthesis protein B, partial [Syntrophaceae bacterium]|nr:molybdopterin-guanine dinucleotide biosynthesis protein B [Syntrophaceae bacterium]